MIGKNKSVMVGMSGGVDSTVTALLLLEQGYDVVGVTFKLWAPEDGEELASDACCSIDHVRDAKMVCAKLGIPHYVFNYKDLFQRKIIQPFVDTYLEGKTPNPCVECNRIIKFDDFLKRAIGMGYDYVSTGHYAVVEEQENGEFRLKKGVHIAKDQTYFLYNLTGEQLSHVLMPLGTYTKDEVRKIAADKGFKAATTPDSQDICFVPDGDYTKVLKKYSDKIAEEGDFVDIQGNVIGRHNGICNYTIGQRKGLGVSFGSPVYVIKINSENNQVVLGSDENLFSDTLYAEKLNWITGKTPIEPFKATAKIRSTAKEVGCTVYPDDKEGVKVVFNEPQRAITPGQSVTFYDNDYVLGGGLII